MWVAFRLHYDVEIWTREVYNIEDKKLNRKKKKKGKYKKVELIHFSSDWFFLYYSENVYYMEHWIGKKRNSTSGLPVAGIWHENQWISIIRPNNSSSHTNTRMFIVITLRHYDEKWKEKKQTNKRNSPHTYTRCCTKVYSIYIVMHVGSYYNKLGKHHHYSNLYTVGLLYIYVLTSTSFLLVFWLNIFACSLTGGGGREGDIKHNTNGLCFVIGDDASTADRVNVLIIRLAKTNIGLHAGAKTFYTHLEL